MLALLGNLNPRLSEDELSSEEDNEATLRNCISHEAMVQLNEMRVNNQLCDACIKTEKGEVFNVHRAMICACSGYFRVLFTTNLNEPKQETTLVGIPGPLLEKIIRYAYLREVDIDESNCVQLMIAADFLIVDGLMRHCIEFIIKILSPENCVIYWLMSRYRCIERLRERTRNYILKNFVKVAVESQQILELNFVDFHSIISDDMLNVKDESAAWECIVRWIDHKPGSRASHLTTLMRAVRLGLLSNQYFMEHVKRNKYVENDPEARPIVLETLRFLCDLETMSSKSNEFVTPALAVPRLPHEVIFAIGGWSEGAPQAVVESYDTRADRWVRLEHEDPAGPRSYHGTAVIGCKLYCIGGFNGTDYFNKCTRFDAEKKTWREIAPMHIRRCYVSVASLNGKIYALGGYDGHSRQNTVERYDPKKNQWTMIASMNMQRSDADACTMEGKIYVTGGFNGQECLNTSEFYTPETNSWTMLPTMLSRRSGVSCVAHQGFIYVIGGFNGIARMNSGERYNSTLRAWTSIKEMYHPRSNFGLEIIDEMIMAIGGFNGVVTISHVEAYVPENNEWLEATDMSIIRSALTANVVQDLPNVRDYLHQARHNLVEERRLKLFRESSTDLIRFGSEVNMEQEEHEPSFGPLPMMISLPDLGDADDEFDEE